MILKGVYEGDNNPQSQIQPLFGYFLQTHENEDIILTENIRVIHCRGIVDDTRIML